MRKTIYALALLFTLGSLNVAAQEEQGQKKERKKFDRTEMIKSRTERMATRYGLNDKQKEKLLELNTEYADKMRPMGRPPRMRPPQGGNDGQMASPQEGEGNQKPPQMEGDDVPMMPPANGEQPSEEDMKKMKEQMDKAKEQMDKDREAYNKKLKKIMTDDQYAKFEQDQKNREQRKPRRRTNKNDE